MPLIEACSEDGQGKLMCLTGQRIICCYKMSSCLTASLSLCYL